MPKLKPLLHLLSERGRRIALAVAAAMLLGVIAPASAQLFPFFNGPSPQRGGGWFGGDDEPFFAPFRRRAPPPQRPAPERREDYSRAPPPDKREAAAERYVLVLGDAMADWLGYGLEDALSETPELGVIRKHKTVSGLIRYQSKGEPSDWAAAAKEILATEKPEAIVVMLGLHDRMPIREPAAEKKKDSRGKADGKTDSKTDSKAAASNGAADAANKADRPGDHADDDDADAPSAPEKNAHSSQGVHQFRDERWVALYSKKIDEMIAVLKSKGVPVLWVGLPAIRGAKSTADALFLDSLYRDAAGRAGITYVDVWDGFVDESGRYVQQGPDFEGQIRRLRSYDGVYFTKAGARKLAHYVEREITRLMASRSSVIEIPAETTTPDANAKPEGPAPRPIAGPIMPLVASSVGTDELLGGAGSRPAAVDPLAARTLVKGDPLTPPPGRADDSAWPRREVAHEKAGDPVVAVVARSETASRGAATAAVEKPKKRHVHVMRPPSDQRAVVYGEGAQRRIYIQRPQMMPPPPGPGDWLSRLFR